MAEDVLRRAREFLAEAETPSLMHEPDFRRRLKRLQRKLRPRTRREHRNVYREAVRRDIKARK